MRKTWLIAAVSVLLAGCTTTGGGSQDKTGSSSSLPKPKGNLRYSITVSEFENKAGWSGRWNIGDAFVEIMTDALQQSGWFIVLGDKTMRKEAMDEQDFAASGRAARGKKAPATGQMTPAQLLLKGAITHIQESAAGGSGGFNFRGISIGGSKASAEINLTIYLVDSTTGQLMASTKVVGKSGRRGMSVGYHGSALGGLTGDLAGFKNDNVGKATEDAVGQALVYLVKQLEKVPWEGTVMKVDSDRIMVNRGTREGVEVGNKFQVGSVERVVDDDTGEVLDETMKTVGTMEVTEAKEKLSYCKPLTGGDKIKKGMSVHQAE